MRNVTGSRWEEGKLISKQFWPIRERCLVDVEYDGRLLDLLCASVKVRDHSHRLALELPLILARVVVGNQLLLDICEILGRSCTCSTQSLEADGGNNVPGEHARPQMTTHDLSSPQSLSNRVRSASKSFDIGVVVELPCVPQALSVAHPRGIGRGFPRGGPGEKALSRPAAYIVS